MAMKISKQLFAAAAAHGITPEMVATWHPELPRAPRVLVPIRVDALVVREAGGTWADCRMNAPDPAAPGPIRARDLLPAPFTDLPRGREPGVYLHWALPDALTRGAGTASATQAASFPAVPDRWLVVRIGGESASLTRRSITGWVIESGGREPRVTPLAGWSEPGPQPAPDAGGPIEPLTALGHGDPAWAAYYDNVEKRLGFHDTLKDVSRGPLAYLVCGWYSDPAHDVLGDGVASLADFESRLDALRWELPPGALDHMPAVYERLATYVASGLPTREGPAPMQPRVASAHVYETPQAPPRILAPGVEPAAVDPQGKPLGGYFTVAGEGWPRHTLYHGGIVGLGWPDAGIPVARNGILGGGDEVGGPPSAANVRVAFGHSLTDALAALLAANGHSADQARALEMALLDASDDLDAADARSRIDVRVHDATFGALPVPPTHETIRQTPPAPPTAPPHPDPARTDPGIFAGKVPRPGGTHAGRPAAGGSVSLGVDRSVYGKLAGVDIRESGLLNDAIAQRKGITGAGGANVPPVARDVEVARAAPRFFVPSDPVVLLQGVNRSFKHGGDGLQSESGKLPCRVSGMVTTSLTPRALEGHPGGGGVHGPDLLERDLGNGSIPPECDELLHELALLDPGSATFAARANARGERRLTSTEVSHAARVYAVEQTAWWAARDPRHDPALFAAHSGFAGTLPAALAVTAPVRPWVPLHLDWEIEYVPSGGGMADWNLGEVDFDAQPETLPAAGDAANGLVLSGRALLTGGAARTAAAAVRQTLDRAASAGGSASLTPGLVTAFHSELARAVLQQLGSLRAPRSGRADPLGTDDLRSLADALAEMDVLAGALDSFHMRLRGGFIGDGQAAPGAGEPQPDPFVQLRAGFLRVRRLRLVDCYGQILDLAGSSKTAPVDMSRLVRSEPMTVADRPDLLELAPRFTAPARLMLRFTGAANDDQDATDALSPVCGFLLPDHLDAELQFHGGDGAALGAIRFDADAGVRWEAAPGTPGAVGVPPRRILSNAHLAGIARGLLDWGVADVTREDPENSDTALSALLRVIDTTLWTVDPFGHTGDEHLSLLVGHPVAVLRARLTLEVSEPIRTGDLQGRRVPVRLGALAQWQDGLLGYFVDDDYTTLHVPDPAAAGFARPVGPGQGFLQQVTAVSDYYADFAAGIGVDAVEGDSPVTHDFVDTSGVLWLRPGQTARLTLLMEPHSVVHATSGLLPRKAIGMRRQWVAGGLAAIAPSFRFGPVLVEAKRIRMPVASELHGTWSWCHRVDPTSWREDDVVNSRSVAELPTGPVEGEEGWLRLNPEPPAGEGS